MRSIRSMHRPERRAPSFLGGPLSSAVTLLVAVVALSGLTNREARSSRQPREQPLAAAQDVSSGRITSRVVDLDLHRLPATAFGD